MQNRGLAFYLIFTSVTFVTSQLIVQLSNMYQKQLQLIIN